MLFYTIIGRSVQGTMRVKFQIIRINQTRANTKKMFDHAGNSVLRFLNEDFAMHRQQIHPKF